MLSTHTIKTIKVNAELSGITIKKIKFADLGKRKESTHLVESTIRGLSGPNSIEGDIEVYDRHIVAKFGPTTRVNYVGERFLSPYTAKKIVENILNRMRDLTGSKPVYEIHYQGKLVYRDERLMNKVSKKEPKTTIRMDKNDMEELNAIFEEARKNEEEEKERLRKLSKKVKED